MRMIVLFAVILSSCATADNNEAIIQSNEAKIREAQIQRDSFQLVLDKYTKVQDIVDPEGTEGQYIKGQIEAFCRVADSLSRVNDSLRAIN